MAEQTSPVVLRPVSSTLIATTVVCAVFDIFGLVVVLHPFAISDPSASNLIGFGIFGGPIIALFTFVAIRTLREKLVLADDYALICNIFWTRRIPRELVVGYDFPTGFFTLGNPAIQWRKPHRKGKRAKTRTTVINFLSSARISAPGLGQ